MSGIAGFVWLDSRPADRDVIERMLRSMRRRGPDRATGWTGDVAALGQVLLATTPEAHVRQPWVHPESGRVVVSDSRLDNRPQLLAELGLSTADTAMVGDAEIIHAAHARWGTEAADKLLGDFTYAIWDPGTRTLSCGRDGMGVRPFYYAYLPDRVFAFASEAEAVLTVPGVPRRLDEGRLADALVGETEGVDKVCTFYRDVCRMPPAHTLELRHGRIRLTEYWRPLGAQPVGLPRTDDEWVEALRSVLRMAVARRLRTSARVGSTISGGLDSSAIAATAKGILGDGFRDFPTWSAINSADAGCAETFHARLVVQALGSNATFIDLANLGVLADQLRDDVRDYREPFDGTMALGAAIYRSASAMRVRCVLDGALSDDLYSTAGFHARLAERGRWVQAYRAARTAYVDESRVPGLCAVRAVIGTCVPAGWRRRRADQAERQRYVQLLEAAPIDAAFARRVNLWARFRRYQADLSGSVVWHQSGQGMSRMSAAYITAGIERYGRLAAYYGVEPRHPYADRSVIEFHAWVPAALRHRAGRSKWLLRRAVAGDLPPAVAWRSGKEHLGSRFSARMAEHAGPSASNPPRLGEARRSVNWSMTAPSRRGPSIGAAELRRAALTDEWLHAHQMSLMEGRYV